MSTTTPLPTQNEAWGFYGTIAQAGIDQETRLRAWAEASRQIKHATSCSDDAVRAFLDSRWGRHFADDVAGRIVTQEQPLAYAIEHAVARWMGWRISRADSRDTGIPAGLPALTGYVESEGFAAERASE